MARRSQGRSALSRQLAILGAFDVDAAFLTLSQLSRRTGLPVSSTHRLIGELVEHGLLERLEDQTYRLGIKLWELAAHTPGALGLREIALPFMQDVHAAVKQHTQLGILEGRDVLFLERLSTREAVVNVTIVGGRLPLHASSSGLILLAHAPQSLQDDIAASPMKRYTHLTIASAQSLRSELATVRRQGFAVGDGFIHPEARGIAVPIMGTSASPVASLSIIVPNDASRTSGYLQVLREGAERISEALRAAYLPSGAPGADPGGRIRPLVHSSTRSMEYLALERGRNPPGGRS